MSTVDSQGAKALVRQVMTPNVLGIVPSAPLDVVLRMMVEAGVHHLPVVDGGRCVGLLHESDVLWRLWSHSDRPIPPASAVTRVPVASVEADEPVRSAARRMSECGSDAVLVLDAGRIVGILTATDLVRRFAGDDVEP